ncbi:hypothetical protein AAE02nite_36020 [Adhaeribacter aerolatus]|uniref:Uncharacterized protein n=2 Tax=Adhaeribacter aerolatus TaxID=670289 RepID=A0A512B1T6_9BACT|nr:hypothetical protein AAE02nite_36020 [Adhaeribacter aerolatus]
MAADRTPQAIDTEATAQTRTMEKSLNFNEYEYIQIKKLNKQRLVDLYTAQAELTTDSSALASRLAQIEKTYDQSILKVLHTNVHTTYAQLRQTTNPAGTANGVL